MSSPGNNGPRRFNRRRQPASARDTENGKHENAPAISSRAKKGGGHRFPQPWYGPNSSGYEYNEMGMGTNRYLIPDLQVFSPNLDQASDMSTASLSQSINVYVVGDGIALFTTGSYGAYRLIPQYTYLSDHVECSIPSNSCGSWHQVFPDNLHRLPGYINGLLRTQYERE